MAVNGTSSTGSTGTTTTAATGQGVAGLTADDFMKLLITQLKTQDPLEPMGNEQLLSQVSTMRELQSNVELTSTLSAILGGQQLTTAAGIIGKEVTGTSAGKNVTGVADRAYVADGVAYVGIGSKSIALKDLLSVSEPGASSELDFGVEK